MNTPWDSVAKFGESIIDKIWPSPEDKAKRDEAKAKLIAAQQAGELQEMEHIWKNAGQQIEVNKAAATSDSLFVAGGRPFIIWVCGTAFAYNYVLQPLLVFGVALLGYTEVEAPQLDFTAMMPVLLGLLGLGGYRTYEKKAGVQQRSTGA